MNWHWRCHILFSVFYLWMSMLLLLSLCVCERDNWFPLGRGRSNSLSAPWTLLLNLPLSLCLFRERWMWGWSIRFVRQIIQRGEELHQTSRHVFGFSLRWPASHTLLHTLQRSEGTRQCPLDKSQHSSFRPVDLFGFSTSATGFLYMKNWCCIRFNIPHSCNCSCMFSSMAFCYWLLLQ